ncbi:MAG: BamA/TamA family outer membrane protein [Bacteroidales bacterium]|nr:BamA/TamA family outer membrane protein [Bacteroidales bacterium]
MEKPITNYFNANIEFAGNTLSLANRILDGEQADPENPRPFLGTIYSQYARTFTDYRAYFNSPGGNLLAARLFVGLGIPYGNSRVIPFSKQFFSGGASSLRGFQYRSVGPGSYVSDNEGKKLFFDQTGDVKIEANIGIPVPIYKNF